MGKPAFCIYENKGADQLGSTCAADQHLCFCYTESTIPLLPTFEISSHLLWLYRPVYIGPGLKPRRQVFSQRGSNNYFVCSGNENLPGKKKILKFHLHYPNLYAGIFIWIVKHVYNETIRGCNGMDLCGHFFYFFIIFFSFFFCFVFVCIDDAKTAVIFSYISIITFYQTKIFA